MANFVVYTEREELASLAFEWNIVKFGEQINTIKNGEALTLDNISVGETKWCFKVFPNGERPEIREAVSIFCASQNETKKTARVKMSIIETSENSAQPTKNKERKVYKKEEFAHTFEEYDEQTNYQMFGNKWGYDCFLTHNEVNDQAKFLLKGNLLLLIQITLLGEPKTTIHIPDQNIEEIEEQEKLKFTECFIKESWVNKEGADDDNFDEVPEQEEYNGILDKMRMKIIRDRRNELARHADPDAIQNIINQQIELMGSELLYRRINRNLRLHKFESIFAREQCKLYSWREEFFYQFCGHDPSHHDYITPYHITRNFNLVTALVCSENDQQVSNSLAGYFEENQEQACNARVYDRDGMEVCSTDKDDLDYVGLGFNDGAQMIMALHRKGPSSLMEIAMKTVFLHDLPLEETPKKEVQNVALYGFYSVQDPIPSNLTSRGQDLFKDLRTEFGWNLDKN